MCQTCGTSQGPFKRIVLALTPGTVNMPAKNQIVLVLCKNSQDCNTRRGVKDNE